MSDGASPPAERERPVTYEDYVRAKPEMFDSLRSQLERYFGYQELYRDDNGEWILTTWDAESKSGAYMPLRALASALASWRARAEAAEAALQSISEHMGGFAAGSWESGVQAIALRALAATRAPEDTP